MKKTLFISVFTLIAFSSIAQSVILSPNNLQIPSVSALPACAAADYGKIVFLTTTNRANVCGSSGWIEVTAGGGGGPLIPFVINQSLGTALIESNNLSPLDANAIGVEGSVTSSTAGIGVLGLANNTAPINNSVAVQGNNQSTNANGIGVFGRHFGNGFGVYGLVAGAGTGVLGAAGGGGTGVYGVTAGLGNGVWGASSGPGGVGVYGLASSTSIAGSFLHTVNGGVALLTSGKLRFQGNGAAVGKIMVCDNINGNAEWKDITRTNKLKLGAAAFQSSISSNNSTIGSQGVSLTNASTNSFFANVSLPDLATVTQIKIYYIDNDGVAPSTGSGVTAYALQKIIHTSTNVYLTVVSGIPTNTTASSSILSNSQNLTEVIDNQNAFYRFLVSMPVSTNLIFIGAEVSYSYTVND